MVRTPRRWRCRRSSRRRGSCTPAEPPRSRPTPSAFRSPDPPATERGAMDTTRFSADRIGGLIWFVFGAAIVYGSWTMDRLEHLHIPPATAPGVVPGLLGLGIMAFALVLLLRRSRAATVDFSGSEAAEPQADEAGFHWKRLAHSAFL